MKCLIIGITTIVVLLHVATVSGFIPSRIIREAGEEAATVAPEAPTSDTPAPETAGIPDKAGEPAETHPTNDVDGKTESDTKTEVKPEVKQEETEVNGKTDADTKPTPTESETKPEAETKPVDGDKQGEHEVNGKTDTDKKPDESQKSVIDDFIEKTRHVIEDRAKLFEDSAHSVQARILEIIDSVKHADSLVISAIKKVQKATVDFSTYIMEQIVGQIKSSLTGALDSLNGLKENLKLKAKERVEKLQTCAKEKGVPQIPSNAWKEVCSCVTDRITAGKQLIDEVVLQIKDAEVYIKNVPGNVESCVADIKSNKTSGFMATGWAVGCIGKVGLNLAGKSTMYGMKLTYSGAKAVEFVMFFKVHLEKCFTEKMASISLDAAKKGIDVTKCTASTKL